MKTEKAMGLFKLHITGALNIFCMYGLGVYITEVVQIIINEALVLHNNLNGEENED